ncbi:hypothetical protein BDF22DRAFT_675850 [Syncephalis plumigaleata]|nr:hypothetical protein BDF22DRAFT_675850 [Syncephalis plumigaleata]
MSFTQFLFGNDNDKGGIEDEELDRELREPLQQNGSSFLHELFSAESLGIDEGDADSNVSMQSFAVSSVAADAMDFSNFQELADDHERQSTDKDTMDTGLLSTDSLSRDITTMLDITPFDHIHNGSNSNNSNAMSLLDQITSDVALASTAMQNNTLPQESPIDIVKRRYPGFEPHKILKFSELFAERVTPGPHKKKDISAQLETTQRTSDKIVFPQYTLPYNYNNYSNNSDDNGIIRSSVYPLDVALYHKGQNEAEDVSIASEIDDNDLTMKATDFYSVALSTWEDDIRWQEEPHTSSTTVIMHTAKDLMQRIKNLDLENGDWQGRIAWEEESASILRQNIHVEFNMNDPHMLFEVVDEETLGNKRRRTVKDQQNVGSTDMLSDLNLSNDKYYEVVRQTFGQLTVQHTLPAIKLQLPYYKIRMSKKELRAFHRPPLNVTAGTTATIQKLKKLSKKEKRVKKCNLSEFIRSAKQLSLRDTGDFVLLEYSEEYPPIISNIGMGSMLVNYYRKEDPLDTFVPKSETGVPFVLEVTDASPFMNFGNVESGQTISALYNNLVRAPIFPQQVPSTDFLVIRHKFEQETKWYLKEIPSLFVIGQTYPVQEVPGPHARISYRLAQRDPHRGLRITKIAKYFNEFNEAQIRQKLKEFMEYQRGSHLGIWKPKPSMPIPNEQQLRRMVTPEMVCLFESMLVGQRFLEDAGYGAAEDDGNMADADSKLELEQQLAPWIATKNFINAAQGKAMLKLYGPGDPTGCGEGFSFLRISMKDVFIRAHEDPQQKLAEIDARPKSAHRYNVAEQQQAYKEEITRIWNTQMQSLSQQTFQEPMDDDMDDEEYMEEDERSEQGSNYARRNSWDDTGSYGRGGPFSPTASLGSSAWDRSEHDIEDDLVSLTESQGSRTSGGPMHGNRYLIIKRRVRQDNGEETWEEERVTEPAVIRAYLRQRQLIEEKSTGTDTMEMINNEEKNRRLKRITIDQLAKFRRNQERRRARALAKQKKEMTFGFRKEGTTCRKCPLWNANGEHLRRNGSDTGSVGYAIECDICNQSNS